MPIGAANAAWRHHTFSSLSIIELILTCGLLAVQYRLRWLSFAECALATSKCGFVRMLSLSHSKMCSVNRTQVSAFAVDAAIIEAMQIDLGVR